MAVTVQTIYSQVCFALLEDGGLQLGLLTEAQFLDIFNVVVLDFAQRAGLVKNIFTTPIQAGVGLYVVPDDVMKAQLGFIGGRIIEKTTEPDLMNGHFEWRRKNGMPRQWHEDNLPPKNVELFPVPDYNGVSYPGDEPPIGKYDDFFPADNNLTIFGPAAPHQTSWELGDPIQCVPDSFTPYLVYGVLEQVFSADGETRDMQRAMYCQTRWKEALSLCDAIATEEMLEDDDD